MLRLKLSFILLFAIGCSEYQLSPIGEEEEPTVDTAPETFDPPPIGSHRFLIVDQAELVHVIDEQANIINSFESPSAIDITYDEATEKVIVLKEVFGESNPVLISSTTGDGGGILHTYSNPNKAEFINGSLVLMGDSEKLEYFHPGSGTLISSRIGSWRGMVEIPNFSGFGALESITGCLWKIHPMNGEQINMICGLSLTDVTAAGMDDGGNLYFSKPGGKLYILESGEISPSIYELPNTKRVEHIEAWDEEAVWIYSEDMDGDGGSYTLRRVWFDGSRQDVFSINLNAWSNFEVIH